MRVDIITLFPSMFKGPFEESMIKRARESGVLEINIHNLREFTHNRHRTVDDAPFGGGAGMIMKIEPILEALEFLKREVSLSSRVMLLSPQGQTLTQDKAKKLAQEKNLILLCGHYEGVDERVREHLIDEEISIGDYVLTGGEVAAMVLVEVIVRMIPGVVGKKESIKKDSFYDSFLDYPQYTRPAEFGGWKVPGVLLKGNHQAIEKWRREKMLEKTWRRRPELLKKAKLTTEDREYLERVSGEKFTL